MTYLQIFHAVLAFAFQLAFLIALFLLDPLYVPQVKDSKPTEAAREAREILMPMYGDSILLHLPPKR